MIHTDVGCCCSLSDVVSSVVFFCCFLFLSAGIEANCLLFFLFFFPLSLYPPFSFFLSLSPPSLLTFPTTFYFIFIFFPLSFFFLSRFLCPLVLSVIVWLNKRVYKIKLINKKIKKKAVNDDSIATHMHCHVLSVLLTGPKKKKKKTSYLIK